MAAVYRYFSALVVLLIVVQIGLAGYGAFAVANDVEDAGGSVDQDRFEDVFGAHMGFGYLVVLSFLILLVLAAIARVGRQRLVLSAVLFGLGILQILLAWIGGSTPAIGSLHPINAFLIAGLAGRIAYASFRGEAAVDRAAAAV